MTSDDDLFAPIADRATELLVLIAHDQSPALAREYDELLFRDLYQAVRRRGSALALQTTERLPTAPWLPRVRPADSEPIALDVTVSALERARRTAGRFDPKRGNGASWAFGAAGYAYIDVVRDFYETRRRGSTISVEPDVLEEVASRVSMAASPEQIVETRAALEAALSQLTVEERFVVLAQAQYGMSYSEIAMYLFGDASRAKRVDTVLQQARRKLAEAERAWNQEPL